uniref:Putative ovule protein n=1 Tax=Solanum chacoense TaxID=4108 RepID=A0A0V0GMA8_SOLCH
MRWQRTKQNTILCARTLNKSSYSNSKTNKNSKIKNIRHPLRKKHRNQSFIASRIIRSIQQAHKNDTMKQKEQIFFHVWCKNRATSLRIPPKNTIGYTKNTPDYSLDHKKTYH